MNVLTFTGNLGRDAEVRHLDSGTPVCNFNVAAKSGFGEREQTLWIRCALWGKRAESGLVQYLVKGQQVAVSGELSTKEHDGKTYLECRVNDVTLCGGKSSASASESNRAPAESYQPSAPAPDPSAHVDDEVPF